MALEPSNDPLARATGLARQEPEPTAWTALSESVMTRVRTLRTPSEPILVLDDRGEVDRDEAGSRTYVSSRVVAGDVRRLLQRAATHAPERIDLRVVDERLVGVELSLVCAYGVGLVELADQVRTDVLAALTTLVGPDPALGPAAVSIEVVDVVVGDPRSV